MFVCGPKPGLLQTRLIARAEGPRRVPRVGELASQRGPPLDSSHWERVGRSTPWSFLKERLLSR
jgi:hypothetical protein